MRNTLDRTGESAHDGIATAQEHVPVIGAVYLVLVAILWLVVGWAFVYSARSLVPTGPTPLAQARSAGVVLIGVIVGEPATIVGLEGGNLTKEFVASPGMVASPAQLAGSHLVKVGPAGRVRLQPDDVVGLESSGKLVWYRAGYGRSNIAGFSTFMAWLRAHGHDRVVRRRIYGTRGQFWLLGITVAVAVALITYLVVTGQAPAYLHALTDSARR